MAPWACWAVMPTVVRISRAASYGGICSRIERTTMALMAALVSLVTLVTSRAACRCATLAARVFFPVNANLTLGTSAPDHLENRLDCSSQQQWHQPSAQTVLAQAASRRDLAIK